MHNSLKKEASIPAILCTAKVPKFALDYSQTRTHQNFLVKMEQQEVRSKRRKKDVSVNSKMRSQTTIKNKNDTTLPGPKDLEMDQHWKIQVDADTKVKIEEDEQKPEVKIENDEPKKEAKINADHHKLVKLEKGLKSEVKVDKDKPSTSKSSTTGANKPKLGKAKRKPAKAEDVVTKVKQENDLKSEYSQTENTESLANNLEDADTFSTSGNVDHTNKDFFKFDVDRTIIAPAQLDAIKIYAMSVAAAIYKARKETKLALPGSNLRQIQMEKKDSEALSEIFAYKIWEVILMKLAATGDISRCYESSPAFQLTVRRLFGGANLYFKLIFPIMCGFLSKDDLQACLQVCKSWNDTVNSNLEKYFIPGIKHVLVQSGTKTLPMKRRVQFLQTHTIPVDKNLPHPSVAGKFVSLNIREDPSIMFDIRRFFNRFGHTISYLELNLGYSILSPSDVYKIFQRSLKNCPNINTYIVNVVVKHLGTVPNRPEMIILQEELPKHVNLKNLEVDIKNGNTSILQNRLLFDYSQQLLSFKSNVWNHKWTFAVEWPRLTKLEIVDENATLILHSLGNFDPRNLTELRLTFNTKINLKKLFTTLKEFPDLECLELSLSYLKDKWSDKEILDLPIELIKETKITKLVLKLDNSRDFAYNFLICFPFLECLTIQYHQVHLHASIFGKSTDFVQLSDFLNWRYGLASSDPGILKRMYRANIWKLLPRLQKIVDVCDFDKTEVQTYVYTRQAYDWQTQRRK